ncbi:TetR/AcrR family transcriptional regulator [Kitasatospora camelliae]|uniref:TetR/AcrR family transcriptional regulator n=1 Tax=Kitasatospora camelliae TaxID=3156397 RepID=A0AAU8K7N2_9ACTN
MKQERARRTYESILDAAAEEFLLLGYAQATLSGVVARTGMTKGALYGHFSSKEALAATLVEQGAAVWSQVLAETESSRLGPVEKLQALTVGLTNRIETDVRVRAALRLASELRDSIGEGDQLLRDIGWFLTSSARRAQATEELSALHSPTAVSHLLMAVVFGYQHLAAACRDRAALSDIEELWEVLAYALRGSVV